MRLPRLIAILVLIATGIASFALAAAGCGGTDPMMMTDDMMPAGDGGASCSQRGTTAFGTACTTDCDCVTAGMICTKTSYDRKPNPICTYTCDSANPNPLCPMGCNPKGYCKVQ